MSLLGVASSFIEQNLSEEGYVGFLLDNFIILTFLFMILLCYLRQVNSPIFFNFLGKFLQKQWSDVNNILKYSAHNFPRLFQPDHL